MLDCSLLGLKGPVEIYLSVGSHEGAHKCTSPQFQHGLKRLVTSGTRAGLEQEPAEAGRRVSSQESYNCWEGCGNKVTSLV